LETMRRYNRDMTAAASMRVSIVIPHLNQPEFLARCLAALAPQVEAMQDVEAIVVDNGSRVLPKEVCGRFDWVRMIQEPIPGPGPARNRGIAAAKAQLLAFIDADCVAHPDWLASLVREFEANSATQIVGGDVRIGLADPARSSALEAYESVFAYRQEEYIEKMGFSGTGNLAMRRAAYEAVGPFAGIEVAEDRDWGRRANAKGLRIKYLPSMIAYHPARKTFAELCRKWDRHVSHDYEELPAGPLGQVKWAGLALAVAASGIVDVRKIVASRRISTLRERLLAATVLARIRFYRARRMLGQFLLVDRKSRDWNR